MASEKVKKEKVSKVATSNSAATKPAKEVSKKSSTKSIDKASGDKVAKAKKVTPAKEEKPVVAKEGKQTKKAKAVSAEPAVQPVVATKPVKEKEAKKTSAKKVVEKVVTEALAAVTNVVETIQKPFVSNEAIQDEAPVNNAKTQAPVQVSFQLRYTTRFGQRLAISGNNEILGQEDVNRALPLQYFNNEYWVASIEVPSNTTFSYNYILINEDGSIATEAGNRVVDPSALNTNEVLLADVWNVRSTEENNLYPTSALVAEATSQNFNYTFRVRAALPENLAVFITGSNPELGNWTEENVKQLTYNNGEWSLSLQVEGSALEYKYGIFDLNENKVLQLETGDNRVFYGTEDAKKLTIISDGFVNVGENEFRIAV